MLDREGYRPNVGIILCNTRNEVFWGKRVREHAWQFPQGGIKRGESPEEAMYRELQEEVGLAAEHVQILGRTREWLRYEVPELIKFAETHGLKIATIRDIIRYRLEHGETSVRRAAEASPLEAGIQKNS